MKIATIGHTDHGKTCLTQAGLSFEKLGESLKKLIENDKKEFKHTSKYHK